MIESASGAVWSLRGSIPTSSRFSGPVIAVAATARVLGAASSSPRTTASHVHARRPISPAFRFAPICRLSKVRGESDPVGAFTG